MTTFTIQELNKIEVTKEEEEAMQALEKPTKEAWVNYGVENPPQYTAEQIEEIQKTMDKKGEWVFNVGEPLPNQLDPQKIIDEMVAQFSISLKLLLTTVIKEGAGKGNSLNAEDQSLQDCVSATLEQAEWFKEMVEEAVSERVEGYLDDRDFDQEVVSAVEYYFSESFRLDDHVDIEHVVEDRLNHATITVQF